MSGLGNNACDYWAWTAEEDTLLAERFADGKKIAQLAKLHSRTYGAIKARLLKLELLQK